jgi:hypothetical protein
MSETAKRKSRPNGKVPALRRAINRIGVQARRVLPGRRRKAAALRPEKR